MKPNLFIFKRREKCLDLTRIVPPTALSDDQARFLLKKTAADSNNYCRIEPTMSLQQHGDVLQHWGLKIRFPHLKKIIVEMKRLQSKYGIKIPVCFIVILS